LWQNGWMD